MTPLSETSLFLPLESSVKIQQVEEDVSVGPSVVVHPSTRTSQEPPVQSSEWRMFLQRRDHKMALGYRDFLRGLEEFERVPSRDQKRSLENDVFRVSLDRALFFISEVALITDLFGGCSVHCLVLRLSAGHPKGGLGHHQPQEEA